MASNRTHCLWHCAKFLAMVLILKVTLGVVLGYSDYLPPHFEAGFLQGRQSYFWTTAYHLAFYVHIAIGPCTLVLGIVLMSVRFRMQYPYWHRFLGRILVVSILLLLVPSGIGMSLYAGTGAIAGVGFATLGVVTGTCASMGWRCAVRKDYDEHRRWMSRCFLLLSSAIVLRLMGGVFSMAGVGAPSTYTFAAWTSWVLPLALYELLRITKANHPETARMPIVK